MQVDALHGRGVLAAAVNKSARHRAVEAAGATHDVRVIVDGRRDPSRAVRTRLRRSQGSFAQRPAVVGAGLEDVDLLVGGGVHVAADIAHPDRAGGPVHADTEGVAQAIGIDLAQGPTDAVERVVRGHGAVQIQAQDLAVHRGQQLTVIGHRPVADGQIKLPVVADFERATDVVIHRRQSARIAPDDELRGRNSAGRTAKSETRNTQPGIRINRAGRVIDVEEFIARKIRIELDIQRTLLAGRVHARNGEQRGEDPGADVDHAHDATLAECQQAAVRHEGASQPEGADRGDSLVGLIDLRVETQGRLVGQDRFPLIVRCHRVRGGRTARWRITAPTSLEKSQAQTHPHPLPRANRHHRPPRALVPWQQPTQVGSPPLRCGSIFRVNRNYCLEPVASIQTRMASRATCRLIHIMIFEQTRMKQHLLRA